MTSANWRMGLNAFVLVFALAIFAGFSSATIINNCQTLSASDTYELDANITYTLEPCLIIDAPNVVLDCKNFAINDVALSNFSTAISITPTGNNAEVKNCVINNFTNYGIFAESAPNLNIHDNVIAHPFNAVNPFTNSETGGIFLNNSLNSQILNNLVDAHYFSGIEARNSNHSLIEGNTVKHNIQYGIRLTGQNMPCPLCGWQATYSTDNTVRGNTVFENGYNGANIVFHSAEIFVQFSNDNLIEDNNVTSYHSQTCADDQYYCDYASIGCEYACGIHMLCTSNTRVLSNNVTGTEMGVAFPNSHWYNSINGTLMACQGVGQNNNVIRGNTIKDATGMGIQTYFGNYTIVDSNLIENSAGTGIFHTGDYFGTVSNNVILNSAVIRRNVATAGLTFAQVYFNTITNNVITDGHMSGILFSQDNDDNTLSGNTISNNQMAGVILGMHWCPLDSWYGDFGNCVVERNTFTNNTISYNALAGGYINFAKNANIVNFIYDQSGTSVDNDSVTWRWSGGQDNRFIDNTILNNGLVPDVSSGGSSSIYFINTPITRSTEDFMSHNESDVTVSWYMNVHVQDSSGIAVDSAQVTITDAFGTVVFTGATDASGNIPRQTLPEYFAIGKEWNTNTNYTDYAPYAVAAQKGISQASVSTPFSTNTALTIVLGGIGAPVISNVHVIDVTQNTVTIGWETDVPANELLDYGTSASYGLTYPNAAFATGHSAFLTGLMAGITYHYKITACDTSLARCSATGDFTFLTATSTGGGGNGGGGNGGGNGGTNPTVAPTTAPTTVPTAGPTTAPTTAPGGVTPTPTIAPTVAATVGASPTIAPGTGLVTAAGPDYGLWGGILLLLILLALLIYWYMRRKKKKKD